MNKKQVTIKDIARIAGVSFSTVSRCLNNSPEASQKTKKRIQQIADDLGFEFNASARGLITSQVGTIAIVLPEEYTAVNVNVYHGMLMNSLRTSLEKSDVDLIVTYEKNHFNQENNIIRLVNRKKIDGLILLVENINSSTLRFLKEKHIPYVFTHFPPGKNALDEDVVFTNHYMGGQLAAEEFLKRGCDCFAVLSNKDHLEFRLREAGFCETIEKAGFSTERLYCDTTFDGAEALVLKELDRVSQCNALFAINDLMAFGAMRVLNGHGLMIPNQISVIGYDDTDYSRYSSPPLTTIHQPKEEMAIMACDRLFHQINNKKNNEEIQKRRISIDPVLVKRDST